MTDLVARLRNHYGARTIIADSFLMKMQRNIDEPYSRLTVDLAVHMPLHRVNPASRLRIFEFRGPALRVAVGDLARDRHQCKVSPDSVSVALETRTFCFRCLASCWLNDRV